VDINRLAELSYVRVEPGVVRVGALARHTEVERDAAAYQVLPLLRQATAHVAHPAIRNRGTTVGSLAHADPAAELPAVLALLSGTVTLASAAGRRSVPAAEFFVGPLESAVRPGELAVEASFPVPPRRTGTAWLEISRRRGDYAVCGVGVLVTLDPSRCVAAARAAYVSVGPTPAVVDLTEAVAGQPGDAADWSAAGALAASTVRPEDDIHASAAYRRHLVSVLTARAARAAVARA
jgi:carbon-monoxide dehydrogenase medium subunit